MRIKPLQLTLLLGPSLVLTLLLLVLPLVVVALMSVSYTHLTLPTKA